MTSFSRAGHRPRLGGVTLTRRALGGTVSVPFIRRAGAQAPTEIEWVAGRRPGPWYAMAVGIATLVHEENPDLRIRIVPGSLVANPSRVQNGLSQIGWGYDFLSQSAVRGQPPFIHPHDRLRSLGGGYSPTEHHFVRHADSPADIRAIIAGPGARIGVPLRSSSDALTFQRILEFYDSSPETLRAGRGRLINGNYNDLIAAWNDGVIDHVYAALPRPAAMMAELAQGRRRGALLSFPQDLMDHLTRTFGYGQGVIPIGTYPALQSDDVAVTTMDSVILVHASMSDELAGRIVTTLVRNRGERLAAIHPSMVAFDPAVACRYRGVALHPGAVKAFGPACAA